MSHWPLKTLGELCDVRIGRTPRRDTPKYWGHDNVWVTIGDLKRDTITNSKEHISHVAVRDCMPPPVPTGTLLFSFKLSIGRMAIAGCPLFTNEAIAALPLRNPLEMTVEFLRYALMSKTHEGAADSAVLGRLLNKKKVEQIVVPVPPLAEQERIVRMLDEADAIRKLRAQADQRTADLIPALFHAMFGNPVTNPMGWPIMPLGTVGRLDRGRSKHRPRNDQGLYGGKYPFVQTGDVANSTGRILAHSQTYSERGLAQSWLWPAGTLCITIAANIGKTAILTYPACFPDSIVGLTPHEDFNVEFLRQWFVTSQSAIEESAPQMAQRNINLKILGSLKVPAPPLSLQRDFAKRVSTVRSLQSQQVASAAAGQATFEALLDKVFTQVPFQHSSPLDVATHW